MLKVIVAAIVGGVITHKVGKKDVVQGFQMGLIIAVLGLVSLIPCKSERQDVHWVDYAYKQSAYLECEHRHSVEDHFKETVGICSTYTNVGEYVLTGDYSTYQIFYCPKCYNADEARRSYKANLNILE